MSVESIPREQVEDIIAGYRAELAERDSKLGRVAYLAGYYGHAAEATGNPDLAALCADLRAARTYTTADDPEAPASAHPCRRPAPEGGTHE